MASTFCSPAKLITGMQLRRIKRMSKNSERLSETATFFNKDEDVLIRAGIDPEKMEYLPGKERRSILKKAGLNPDEFDF